METKLNIYPTRERVFERELKKLKGSNVSQRNKELITEFQNYLFSTGSGDLRVAKLSSQIRIMCRWLKNGLKIGKDLDKLDKKDVMNLVAHINKLSDKASGN